MAKKQRKKQKPKGLVKPVMVKQVKPKWDSFWKSRTNLYSLLLILVISFVVYTPNFNNGFVNWDDDRNIYENENITEINNWRSLFSNFDDIFTSGVIGNYNPLPIFSFGIEKVVYGFERPEMWHFDNILLHLICVILVFRIALALGLKLIPAIICGLLFGIHPLRVESVAWITERKDVMFGAFYLLAFYYYIKSIKIGKSRMHQAIILTSFLLACFSKIQAVALPLSMLAVDFFLGRKLSFRLITEKWLYFLISLITGLVGIYFLRDHGSLESNASFSFFERLFIGSYSYLVYLVKSLVPYRMVPLYPYPATIGWMFYASMIPALGFVFLMYYGLKKNLKHLTFGLLFFTFNIMFLLQILSAGQGFIADRFTYIAYFGIFFFYSYGFQWILEQYGKYRSVILGLVALVLLTFGYLNFQQNKIWKNGETLWTHVLEYYQRATLPWGNRANYYRDMGRYQEALHDYSKTIALNAQKAEPYNSRGKLFFLSENPDTLRLAIADYSSAINIQPNNPEYRVNRASSYARLNMYNEALADMNAAEQMDPNNPNLYFNRSIVYHKLGRYNNEIADLKKYLQLKPNHADMWYNLAIAQRLTQQYNEALVGFNKAIQLNPAQLAFVYDRAVCYFQMKDYTRARQDLAFLKSRNFNQINPAFEQALNQAQ